MHLTINKLAGYAGLRLKDNEPLEFKKGINLLVGRNGSGKSNLIRLIQFLSNNQFEIINRVESSYLREMLSDASEMDRVNIIKSFGKVELAKVKVKDQDGIIYVTLKNIAPDNVVTTLLMDDSDFSGHVDLHCNTPSFQCRIISASQSVPKFEMSGYPASANFLSQDSNSGAHRMMQTSIEAIDNFIRTQLKEFYSSERFLNEINRLETSINKTFERFLGNANKTIKINSSEISAFGRVSLVLHDHGNVIKSETLSTGEMVLFNFIFGLSSVSTDRFDVLCLDEPDIHMHDDMIQVLVDEVVQLSSMHSDSIIIVATHSTTLVEKLSNLAKHEVNIVSIDNERKVSSSKDNVELVRALNRNGVAFSPLMLSKQLTIFIENRYKTGKEHQGFLAKFFLPSNLPYIIPIGTSDNVDDSESFAAMLEDILKASGMRSVVIQDGDVWFKKQMAEYLQKKIELPRLLERLTDINGAAFAVDSQKQTRLSLNFWEIENLYLANELVDCWIRPDGTSLDVAGYHAFVNENRATIRKAYFTTYFNYLFKVRPKRTGSLSEAITGFDEKVETIRTLLSDPDLDERMNLLVDSLIQNGLTQWLPGKELLNLLRDQKYRFVDGKKDLSSTLLGESIREILTF